MRATSGAARLLSACVLVTGCETSALDPRGSQQVWQRKGTLKSMPSAQVIEETNGFYNKLKSGERENTEGLSLV